MPDMVVQIKDDTGKPRYLGEITNRIFTTKKKKSKHLFRKMNAWGIDCRILDAFVRKGDVDYIIVLEEEENVSYVTTPQHFKLYAQVYQFGGHRPQYFLSLPEWKEITGGGTIDEIIRKYNE